MGLRSQADYNRHFVIDAEGYEVAQLGADALFSSLQAFLVERGIGGE